MYLAETSRENPSHDGLNPLLLTEIPHPKKHVSDELPTAYHDTERQLYSLGPRGQHTFQIFSDNKALSKTPPIILHGTLAQHWATLVYWNRKGAGIFVTINETDGKGRKTANIIRVRCFVLDLDGAPLPKSWPLEPHVIVETSPGKYHCYWMIDFLPLEHFKLVQKALAKRFNGDPAVCDLPRVMRLAGFVHQKGKPFLSRIIQATEGRYSLADFLKAFGIALPQRKMAPEPTRKPSGVEATGLLGQHLNAIRSTPVGARNVELNKHAFQVGQLVAGGFVSEDIAIQNIIEAGLSCGLSQREVERTARRSLQEGIQKGPYRIPAPPPHFDLGELLPPQEARNTLGEIILDRINVAENWKHRLIEIRGLIERGFSPAKARRKFLESNDFQDLKHAPRYLIRATPGTGKTRQAIQIILESSLEKVLLYTPTSNLGDELSLGFPGQIKVIRGRNQDNCEFSELCSLAGKKGLNVFATFCEQEAPSIDPHGRARFLKCRHFDKCKYLAQFQNTGERIIVLSHEYLKPDIKLLRKLAPVVDLHVIDESIIAVCTGSTHFLPAIIPADFRDMKPGDDARAVAMAAGWTLEDVQSWRDDLHSQIQRDTQAMAMGLYPGVSPIKAMTQLSKVIPVDTLNQWRFAATLARQWPLDKGIEAISIRTFPITVEGKTEQQLRVSVSFKKDSSGLREAEPLMMLDADGNLAINQALVSKRMEAHQVDAHRNVFIIQIATSSSKTALFKPNKQGELAATEKLTRFAKIIRELIPGNKLVVTYKSAEPLADFGTDAQVTHFGGFLGQNSYKDLSTAIVFGRNLPPVEAMETMARAIYMDDPEPLNLRKYEQTLQGYTMADGSHRGAKVQTHPDPRVNAILDIHRGQLSAQAIDRLRLVNDGKPKLAIILDSTPAAIPVDSVVSETGFLAMLAVGTLLSKGHGFAILNAQKLQGVGLSSREAEKIMETMGSLVDSDVPLFPPAILDLYRGGESWNTKKAPSIQARMIGKKSHLFVSALDEAGTESRHQGLFGPVQVALDECGGVLPLNVRWLVKTFPDLFKSVTGAYRAIETIEPTGFFRAQGKGISRNTPFLCQDGTDNPRLTLETLLGTPMAFYEGPGQ